MTSALKKGTLKCPTCKEQLHFECMGMMRVVRNDFLHARCPVCKTEHQVTPNEDHSK